MVKKNLIEEIQKLVQQIKNEYQEGVDYKTTSSKEMLSLEREVLMLNIISSKLKKYCRSQIGFPVHFPDGLSYYLGSQEQDPKWFFYQTEQEVGGSKIDAFIFCEGIEASGSRARERFEKCDFCGEPVDKKKGRMEQWNQSRSILACFHPECAKKYFVEKEQPNENNSQIKEKLLRNLDKISLDPIGYLANAEIIKSNEVEENYNGGKTNSSDWNAWNDKVRQVEIQGEKINLTELSWADKLAIRKAVIAAIKSNPQDWKIESSNIYANPSQGIPDSFKILRHKSGYRHWNVGILHLNESYEQGQKDWAEIEALLSGSTIPEFNNSKNKNSISYTEKEQIRQYFLENNVKEIKFENGKLVITHNNNNETRDLQQIFHDPKLLEIMNYCEKNGEGKITKQTLGLGSNNTSTNSEPDKDNHKLVIGLAVGVGVTILVGTIAYFVWKRKNKNKK